MKRKLFPIVVMAAVALVSASCSSSKKTSNDMVVSRNNMAEVDRGFLILSDAQRALTANNNDFALQLFGKISGFDSKVVSPLSIDYLMGMLANGAEGATRDEILKAIKANGLSLDEVNNYYKVMMQKGSGSDESPVLSIANYMAVNKNVRIEEGFSRTVTDNYMAGMESLDFSSSKAVRRINEWCSKQTNGMVPRIIDSTDPSAVSYVMNAIYFNNTWVNQFDADDTRQERFQGYTRDIKKVMMMHQEHKFRYMSNDKLAAVSLPYGNGDYDMTVILPNNGLSVSDVMKPMSSKDLAAIDKAMTDCLVDLKLPRFTTETELPLNDVISELGAPTMFMPGKADFSNMCKQDMHVSKMLQKAKIEVNERGTKAAAVTAAIMTMSALQPEQPKRVSFHANRPFAYIITDRADGAILFMGQFTGE
ncbi:MAG: serpin family protein [Prevotella sp.]|nr:serpin family protein [Prevotella sp.]